jgi:anti-sigma factor RsiW
MMDHQTIKQLLPAYVDDELGLAEALDVERHIAQCPECERDCMEQRSVRQLLKRHAGYAHAPAYLAERISKALPPNTAPPASATRQRASWFSMGLALASLCMAALGGGYLLGQSSVAQPVAEELVSSHIRSLQLDHLLDVASSDRHTVKPWFNGKLDFSPPVVDLAPQGFPLAGGRLDALDGHPVAVLVFHRDRHPINLYVWPATGPDAPPRMEQERGYHLLQWTEGKMHYWVISDLARDELKSFTEALRGSMANVNPKP